MNRAGRNGSARDSRTEKQILQRGHLRVVILSSVQALIEGDTDGDEEMKILCTYFAITLPGSAMVSVCWRPPVGVKTAEGLEVSTSSSAL